MRELPADDSVRRSPVVGIVRGVELVRAFVNTRTRQYPTRHALKVWQEERIVRMLRKVVPDARFFRDHLGSRPIERWRELPELSREAWMDAFDDINTVGLHRDDLLRAVERGAREVGGYRVGLSSGTEGRPGLFVGSVPELAQWVGVAIAKGLPPGRLTRQRLALFTRPGSSLRKTPVRFPGLKAAWFDLGQAVRPVAAELEALDPTTVIGPPSMLRQLTRSIVDGAVTIAPNRVIAIGEVLDPLDEDYIRRGLRQPVHQVYQAIEGLLGSTCPHGTLHLAEDTVFVEKDWIDRDRRKFLPIVTHMGRTVLPMIRVRVDDVLTKRAEPCPCGSVMTAIESVEGRLFDAFEVVGQRGGTVRILPDEVRRSVLGASPYIREYVVRQEAHDRVVVFLDVRDADLAEAQRRVGRALDVLWAYYGGVPPAVRFEHHRLVPSTRKLRRVENAREGERG